MANKAVFLDANVIIYALDRTSDQHEGVVKIIDKLLKDQINLCSSNHVIEEVLHIIQRIPQNITPLSEVVEEINNIPNLIFIEPSATIDFSRRYAKLCQQPNLGVNDALILQLMIDAGISRLFSYDKKLIKEASTLNIEQVS